jgi:hypothetical protein
MEAKLVEALHYQPAGTWFYFRWCHWNFSFTQSSWPEYGLRIDKGPARNEYQKYFLEEKATGALY